MPTSPNSLKNERGRRLTRAGLALLATAAIAACGSSEQGQGSDAGAPAGSTVSHSAEVTPGTSTAPNTSAGTAAPEAPATENGPAQNEKLNTLAAARFQQLGEKFDEVFAAHQGDTTPGVHVAENAPAGDSSTSLNIVDQYHQGSDGRWTHTHFQEELDESGNPFSFTLDLDHWQGTDPANLQPLSSVSEYSYILNMNLDENMQPNGTYFMQTTINTDNVQNYLVADGGVPEGSMMVTSEDWDAANKTLDEVLQTAVVQGQPYGPDQITPFQTGD